MPRLSDHRDGSSSSSAAARGEGEDVVASSAVVGDHDRDRRAGNDYVDDGGPVHVRENSTFSELAAAMVPAYFQWTVDLCAYTIARASSSSSSSSSSGDNATDDVDVDIDDSDGGDRTSAMPGEVYALRKTMLRTRDLLDVFSPVYSRRSSLDDYDGWASTTRIIRWGGGRGQRVELDVESDGRTGGNSRRRKNSSTTSRSSSSSSSSSSRRRRRKRREDGGKKRGGHANDDGGGGAAERSRPPPSSVHVAGGGVGSSLGSSLGRFLGWGLEAIGDWKVGKREEKEQTTTTTRGGKDGEAIIHDLWGTLRGFLDDGYMLLGDFQDLDHANVTYPPERLLSYQRRIWEWRAGFMTFVETNGPIVSFYLSLPCIGDRMRPSSSRRDGRCSHVHRRPSHLFWGNASADDLPDGNADAASIALGRLGYLQLGRAEAYLRDALAYEYVLNSTGIPPEIDATTNETGGEDVDDDLKEGGDEDDGGGLVDVHAIYHNVRKELRSFLDELDMFGGLLLPGTSVIPEIARDGPSIVSANVHIDEERRELIDRAIHALSKMKAMLGDLNDDYVAYSMYKEWDVYPEEVLVLGTRVENRWKDFRAWANEVGLFAKIEFLRGCLFPDESLSTEIEDEGKEVEEKTVTSDLLSHNLESFLIERKTNPTDHVVLGNDAGDADSIISAITLAYIESRHSTGLGNATPIVSIPKDEFTHERPETNLLFQLAGLKDNVTEILLFIEDLRDILDEDMRGGGLLSRSVSLVDHNTLNDPLLTFQENIIVTEILDHHEDEHKYEETCSGDHRIIAFDNGHVLVASTTTLVAERLRLEKYPIPYPASIGTLLLGVILLDSINLDESLGKVTERDREAVADLLTNTDWSAAVQSSHIRINDSGGITVDTNDLFNKLQLSKYNPKYWDELPVPRALASDYKHFGDDGERKESEFGIASILMKGEDFMNKDGFDKATLEFMHTAHISFLGIIFVFYDEGSVLHKQLAFISSDGNLEELINSLLISDAYKSVNLQLEEVSILSEADRSLKIRLFDQENLAPSRKQIGPMLEDYFGSV
ncbi:hypothetical protein ACHAW5_007343 [Stephanodiscus triporus]|uniref:DHHA2 domain-containing protein n=1 Tax=Stephanodiscus triporus TaxID=2934178 RepID=A0ABD3N9F3_9STRA